MTNSSGLPARGWLSPVVHLSNNWLSLIGVIVVTTATVLCLLLLPATLRGNVSNPYFGIVLYLMLPAVFIGGLLVIPLGIWLRRRRESLSLDSPSSSA